MEFIKDSFKKILFGALFGLGFTVMLGGGYYYLTQKMMSETLSGISFKPGTVEITKDREIERDDRLLILGEVKNIGEANARGIKVTVDLYQDNEFVKQCSTSVNGELPPGETRNFEIKCGGGCKNSPIVEHDSYEVYVTGY